MFKMCLTTKKKRVCLDARFPVLAEKILMSSKFWNIILRRKEVCLYYVNIHKTIVWKKMIAFMLLSCSGDFLNISAYPPFLFPPSACWTRNCITPSKELETRGTWKLRSFTRQLRALRSVRIRGHRLRTVDIQMSNFDPLKGLTVSHISPQLSIKNPLS